MTSLFVIGGARSGKSRYAQQRIEALQGRLAFIATADADDSEMSERIAHHRAERGDRWTTYEAPLHLPHAIRVAGETANAILVDCLTLWLSNLMLRDHDIETASSALEQAIMDCHVPIAIVSNEVGAGIVPMGELTRRFRDHAGWLNQRIAKVAMEVVLISAGLPLHLK